MNQNEKIIERFEVQQSQKKQLYTLQLVLTNMRILLQNAQNQITEDQEYWLHDLEIQYSYENKEKIFAIKLSEPIKGNQNAPQKKNIIRFQQRSHLEYFQKIYEIIQLQKNELTCIKFKLLSENQDLRELYENLVINKGILSEENFWKDKDVIKEYKKIHFSCEQALSKEAYCKVKKTQDFQLTQEQKQNLLRREPILQQKYKNKIKNINEKQFWQDFIQDQLKNDTIVIGGINQIYFSNEQEIITEVNEQNDLENYCLDIDKFEKFEIQQNNLLIKDKGQEKINGIIESLNIRSARVLQKEIQEQKENFQFNDGMEIEFQEQLIINNNNQMEIENVAEMIDENLKKKYFSYQIFDVKNKERIMSKKYEPNQSYKFNYRVDVLNLNGCKKSQLSIK